MHGLSKLQHIVCLDEARRCGCRSDSVEICICQCYVRHGSDTVARLGWESSGITPDDYHFEVLAQFLASPLCPTASIASEVCRYVDTRPLHTLSLPTAVTMCMC